MRPFSSAGQKIYGKSNLSCGNLYSMPLVISIAVVLVLSNTHLFASSRPRLVLQAGHMIRAIVASPDGRWLATTGHGSSGVKLWDFATGQLIRSISGNSSGDHVVEFSPNGRWLASLGTYSVKVWEMPSGRYVRTLEHQIERLKARENIVSFSFDPDGNLLATAGRDRRIIIWVVATGQKVRTLNTQKHDVNAVAFSPDGRWLASRGYDGTIRLWDVQSWSEIRTVTREAEFGDWNPFSFSPDGRWIASASKENKVKLWNVRDNNKVHALPSVQWAREEFIFSPDGRWLASWVDYGKKIKVWDTNTWRLARTLDLKKMVGSVTFSWDGRRLVNAIEHEINIWDVNSGHLIKTLILKEITRRIMVAFSNNGRRLVSCAKDGELRIWDVPTGRLVRTVNLESRIDALALTTKGKVIAGSYLKELKLWEIAFGQEVRSLTVPDNLKKVDYFTMSSNGQFLAATKKSSSKIEIWDVSRYRVVRTLALSGDFPSLISKISIALSSDGHWLAARYIPKNKVNYKDMAITLWDVKTGRELRTPVPKAATGMFAFSSDGRWFVSCFLKDPWGMVISKEIIRITDVVTGQEIRSTEDYNITTFAFSPDKRWLAWGRSDGIIKLWDLTTNNKVHEIQGHLSVIKSLTFSVDGRWLISGSAGGSIAIWQVPRLEEAAAIYAMRVAGDWVVVSPEGLFDGSERGMNELVSWRIGNRVYPSDRFFADFYTPGLIARIFAGERPRVEVDLASLKLPPDVRITSPTAPRIFEQRRIVVKVETKDLGGGTAEVRLYQNGKLVGTHEGKRTKISSYEFSVDLVPGENTLKATALNHQRIESNEDWLRIFFEAPKSAKASLHLLVVGINEYEDPSFDLGFAKPDAEALVRFFGRRGSSLFRSVNTIKLFNDNATKANIQEKLKELAIKARPEDLAIIYMAGHGVGLGQQFYFLTQQMRKEVNEEAAIRKYGISASILGDALRRIRALKQILILDTCQSATALPILAKAALFRGLGAAEDKALKMLARSNGVYLIAASTEQQYAYEVPTLGHGVLTYALLSGLGEKEAPKAPTTGEGIITVYSLLQYVNQVVPELTDKYHGGKKQYPVSSTTGMDFPLAVY